MPHARPQVLQKFLGSVYGHCARALRTQRHVLCGDRLSCAHAWDCLIDACRARPRVCETWNSPPDPPPALVPVSQSFFSGKMYSCSWSVGRYTNPLYLARELGPCAPLHFLSCVRGLSAGLPTYFSLYLAADSPRYGSSVDDFGDSCGSRPHFE